MRRLRFVADTEIARWLSKEDRAPTPGDASEFNSACLKRGKLVNRFNHKKIFHA